MLSYTEAEYGQWLQHPTWTKAETDTLFELCRRFDLRWPVIHDRMPGSRTVEALKDRFYAVCRMLLQGRLGASDGGSTSANELAEHPLARFSFEERHEMERKAEFERLYARSADEVAEEGRRLEQVLPHRIGVGRRGPLRATVSAPADRPAVWPAGACRAVRAPIGAQEGASMPPPSAVTATDDVTRRPRSNGSLCLCLSTAGHCAPLSLPPLPMRRTNPASFTGQTARDQAARAEEAAQTGRQGGNHPRAQGDARCVRPRLWLGLGLGRAPFARGADGAAQATSFCRRVASLGRCVDQAARLGEATLAL